MALMGNGRMFKTFAATPPKRSPFREVRHTSRDLADPRRRAAPSMNSWSLKVGDKATRQAP